MSASGPAGVDRPDPPDGPSDLVAVRLLGFPLDLFMRSREHWDGLVREFTLLTLRPSEGHQVPVRLVELIRALTEAYSPFTGATDRERDRAMARGDATVDLTYLVPVHARQAALDLEAMAQEADEFCRQGEELLTMARPAEVRRFGRWYLGQFVDQIEGRPPRSWPEWAEGGRQG